jgi:hypothetical protein
MQPVRILVALALCLCLAHPAGAAVFGNAAAKKGKHAVNGQVTAVQVDAAKGTGTITVQLRHKKGEASAPPVEKTFTVTSATKVAIISGKKGNVQTSAADLSAVQKGQHVLIFQSGTDVSDLKILKKGKGKKNT